MHAHLVSRQPSTVLLRRRRGQTGTPPAPLPPNPHPNPNPNPTPTPTPTPDLFPCRAAVSSSCRRPHVCVGKPIRHVTCLRTRLALDLYRTARCFPRCHGCSNVPYLRWVSACRAGRLYTLTVRRHNPPARRMVHGRFSYSSIGCDVLWEGSRKNATYSRASDGHTLVCAVSSVA